MASARPATAAPLTACARGVCALPLLSFATTPFRKSSPSRELRGRVLAVVLSPAAFDFSAVRVGVFGAASRFGVALGAAFSGAGAGRLGAALGAALGTGEGAGVGSG
jgi:hypothetical protein